MKCPGEIVKEAGLLSRAWKHTKNLPRNIRELMRNLKKANKTWELHRATGPKSYMPHSLINKQVRAYQRLSNQFAEGVAKGLVIPGAAVMVGAPTVAALVGDKNKPKSIKTSDNL